MSKHYLEHMGSIFEFSEPARFEVGPDGGRFVSDLSSSGKQVFSTDRMGAYSPQKMQALRDAAREEDAEQLSQVLRPDVARQRS